MTRWLALVLVAAVSACAHVGASQTTVFAGGAAQFDPALPRVVLPLPEREGPLSASQPALVSAAGEGSRLSFESLRVRGVIDGPLALTELYVTVHNQEGRVVEGAFVVRIPSGAAVTRFAMREGNEPWQDARIAESAAARGAYERLVRRGIDPGLAVLDGPDRVRVRLFPMRAHGTSEIAITYLHELARADEAYRLPLGGIDQIGPVDVQVLVASESGKRVVVSSAKSSPAKDFVLAFGAPGASGALDVATAAIAEGRGASVERIAPKLGVERAPVERLLVAFDTSASRAGVLRASAERVRELAVQLAPSAGDVPLDVACFDQEIEEVYSGPLRGFGPPHVARMIAREALGGSSLEKALAWAAHAAKSDKRPARLLVVTDGATTAGARDLGELRPLGEQLRASGVARIDALLDGPRPPHALALANLDAVPVAVTDRSLDAAHLAERLGAATSPVALHVAGSTWHWPLQLAAAIPGDEALVFAEKARDGGAREPSPLVDLALKHARLLDLAARLARAPDANAAQSLRGEIRNRSLTSGILTEETALVVLEGDRDYKEAGIDGVEGRGVLVVSGSGVAEGRTRPAPASVAAGEGDNDADGIPDKLDACPDDPWDDDGFEDRDGCPEPADLIPIVHGRPGLLRTVIAFGAKDAELPADKRALLDELAAALRQSPRIDRLEIGGHARARAAAGEAMRLSDTRASAVRAYLIQQGVSPERLVARPYGSERPLFPHDSARAGENDRVDFTLLVVDGRTSPSPSVELATHPHAGRYEELFALVVDKKPDLAASAARQWRDLRGDPLAYVALGQALEASADYPRAARAYGSLLDAQGARPEAQRAAGNWLDRIGAKSPAALELAVDAYRRAAAQRPAQASGRRLLAYALARAGHLEQAFGVVIDALHDYAAPREQRELVAPLLRADLALLGAAWMRLEPARKDAIEGRIVEAGAPLARGPQLSFVLTWEGDTTDLDLVVTDGRGGTASPRARVLRSGGEYRLNTQVGFGPDWFFVDGAPAAFPYRIAVRYTVRGPKSHVLGKVAIVEHDGNGRLGFDERPFVIMGERATLDLGTLDAPLTMK